MSLTHMLKGYSGAVQIEDISSFLTSYSLTLNTNLIRSGAVAPIYKNNKFNMISLAPLRDFPIYELNISIELNKKICEKLFGLIKEYFRDPISINFQDDSIGLELKFSDCYVTSFSLNIQNEAVATASLTCSYYKDTFELESKEHDITQKKNNNVNKDLMPYYGWEFKYNGISNDVNSFSLNYSQTVTPKFGCIGSNSNKAIAPIAYVISNPTVNFQCTYVLYEGFDKSVDSYTKGNEIYNNMKDVTIDYTGISKITFNKCYIDTYSPQLGNPGSANMMSISGTVYGDIV